MPDRSEYENLAATVKKCSHTCKEKSLDVATKTISELNVKLTALTSVLTDHKSVCDWLNTAG